MNDILEILKKARSFISEEKDWRVGAAGPDETCMCSMQAIARAYKEHHNIPFNIGWGDSCLKRYAKKLAEQIPKSEWTLASCFPTIIALYQDKCKHDEVLEMFDNAIHELENAVE